jgi:hypothetical protein
MENHAVVLWDNGDKSVLQPAEDPLLRTLQARVTGSITSFDMFPKPLVSTDTSITTVSRWKTIAFVIIMPIVALSIITWYLLTPQLQAVSLPDPSYSSYLGILKYGPTCTCRNQNIQYGDIGNFSIPAVSNPTGNMCGSILGLVNFCTSQLQTGNNRSTCLDTDAGAVFYLLYLQTMADLCFSLQVGINGLAANVNGIPLSQVLLDPATFNSTVVIAVLDQVQKFMLQFLTVKMSVPGLAIDSMNAVLDASYGATDRQPPGCNCTASAMTPGSTPIDLAYGNGMCTYKAAFDMRTADYRWSCGAANNLMLFPISLLQEPGLYTLLGAPAANFTGFTVDPADQQFMFALTRMSTAFMGVGPSDTAHYNLAQLNSSLLTFHHSRYFTACDPSECRYNFDAPPTVISGLAIAFGAYI